MAKVTPKTLRTIVTEFFALEYQEKIKNHTQLIQLGVIPIGRTRPHPHAGKKICISRKALKHVVDQRKRDLLKRHTKSDAVKKTLFAVTNIKGTVIKYDSYQPQGQRFCFTADYADRQMPQVRVIAESVEDRLEVCTVHFRARRKKK